MRHKLLFSFFIFLIVALPIRSKDFVLLYSIHKEQINYDTLEQEYRLSTAKVLVELELKPEDIAKLNLKKRIADVLK